MSASETGAGPHGRTALVLAAASTALFGVVGLLGPSVGVARLGADSRRPPIYLPAGPTPWLVVALLALACLVGTAGLALALLALRRGWCPDARRLLGGSAVAVVALCLVPPVGSPDPLSYAAYGRIALGGGNPYLQAPVGWRAGTDPVTSAVAAPWETTPSVYGPLATAEQALASALGGDSVARTVWWLSVLGGIAFLALAVLLVRIAGPDPARRARAGVLVAVNPLLLGVVVAGAHLDVVGVALAIAGLLALRRSPLLAGALLGAAVGVKASLALFLLAAAWPLRSRLLDLLRLGTGALLVLLPSYALAGDHAFDQLHRASRYVSLSMPWNLVVDSLDRSLGNDLSRRTIATGAAALAVLLALALVRLVPAPPERAGGAGPDPVTEAARAGAVLVGAWLLSAPYGLPWYDVAWWAPLAVLPASRVDVVALARTATMTLAYVPGLVGLPRDVASLTLSWRGEVTPWCELALVVLVLGWAIRPGRPARPGPPARRPPAPAPSRWQRAPGERRSPVPPPG